MKDVLLYVLIAIAGLILLIPWFEIINIRKAIELLAFELHLLRIGDTKEDPDGGQVQKRI